MEVFSFAATSMALGSTYEEDDGAWEAPILMFGQRLEYGEEASRA